MIHTVTSLSLARRRLPFFSTVWHTAQLYKLRNKEGIHKGHQLTGLRHIVPRGDPLRSEQLTDYLTVVIIAISIQGQQSCFKRHLNEVRFFFSLSGVINENGCRRLHIMRFLPYKKKTEGCWALLSVHRSSRRTFRGIDTCVEKGSAAYSSKCIDLQWTATRKPSCGERSVQIWEQQWCTSSVNPLKMYPVFFGPFQKEKEYIYCCQIALYSFSPVFFVCLWPFEVFRGFTFFLCPFGLFAFTVCLLSCERCLLCRLKIWIYSSCVCCIWVLLKVS